jgi:hypothetical protein
MEALLDFSLNELAKKLLVEPRFVPGSPRRLEAYQLENISSVGSAATLKPLRKTCIWVVHAISQTPCPLRDMGPRGRRITQISE